MVAGAFTKEYESPITVDRLWKAGVLDAHVLMPKLLPEFVNGVEVIEGDGGEGTIKQFSFATVVGYSFVKDRVEVLDAENHVFKYSVVEGGLLGSRLNSYSYEHKFEAAAGGGSKGKLTVEYDTVDDAPLTREEARQLSFGLVTMMKALEGYLKENPALYA